MRFLLLARARTTGTVRLLSCRAYASRTAAVDAATVTAHSIDLGDDEVLAVDLDSAGPVLVLRIPTTPPVAAPLPESDGSALVGVTATEAVAVPATPVEAVTGWEGPASANAFFADGETILRLQPRFPLFGLDDDEVVDENLAETLRRVARRMEADLAGAMGVEWVPVDDTWDARTLGDYAVAEDANDQGSPDEGHMRRDAATCLLRDEEAPSSDTILARHDDDPVRSDEDRTPDECEVSSETASDDRSSSPVDEFGRAGDAPEPADAAAVSAPAPVESEGLDAPDPGAGDRDTVHSESADPDRFGRGLFAGDDDAPAALEPEADQDLLDGIDEGGLEREADMAEADPDSDPGLGSVADHTESPELPVGPEAEGETAVDAADRDTDPEPERDAGPTPVAQPEPEPYRASDVDFAIWVCSDCVYQRTCRKAGVATPATCGNFQWRSF